MPKTLLGFYTRFAARGFYPMLIAWALLFVVGRGANDVLWPLFQKWFISLFERPVPAGMTFVEFALPVVVTIVAALLIFDSFNIIRSIIFNRWLARIRVRIATILNNYLHSQSMEFWTSRIVGKLDTQIKYVEDGFWVGADGFLRIGTAALAIFVTGGLVLAINENIAVVLSVIFAFRLTYGLALLRPMKRAAKTSSDSRSSLTGKQIDSISNYLIVKLFAGAAGEEKHLVPPRQTYIRDRLRAAFFQRLFWAVPDMVWNVSFGVVMFICVILFANGKMMVSDVVFTMSAYFSIMGAIGAIVERIPELVDVLGSAQKGYEELVRPIAITDAPGAKDLVVDKGVIEIKNVWFKYKRKMILRDLSLKIRSGEKIGLVGGSGAGKTTLVNLLMRLYDPTKGAIFVDGRNIREVTQDSLRRNVAFIPQEPAMFNRTLKDNIGYGDAKGTMTRIRAAARSAEIDEFIMSLDTKYESLVGDRGIKLSAGQKQRVAIARAFLKRAPILILDEATSALDSETEGLIQESFAELSKGRTTIAIAHRLSTLRNMDRIVVMKDGRIAEQGTHVQLLGKRNGLYAKLWNMQSGGFISA